LPFFFSFSDNANLMSREQVKNLLAAMVTAC
jgi:hypothetical protein